MISILFRLGLIFPLFFHFFIHAEKDLEEYKHDFVLETKRLFIEKAPDAFNPSIVKWRGKHLMSFRFIENVDEHCPYSSAQVSMIQLVWLDEHFEPMGDPYALALDHPDMDRPFILAEDGRLITIEDRLYLVYSGNKEKEIRDSGFRMYVAELDYDETGFYILSNEVLTKFDGESPFRREKNWVPFVHEEELLLAYTLCPHKIFKPLLDESQSCKMKAFSYPSIVWEWGELRGGTPALRLNEHFYLGFFHSSIPLSTIHSHHQSVLHYFMGAYLFSATPPFEIKLISPEPIIGEDFYYGEVYEPYWHPVRVVFPCGLLIEDDRIWISYGRQDHEIWMAELDKEKLLESLINVSTLLPSSVSLP